MSGTLVFGTNIDNDMDSLAFYWRFIMPKTKIHPSLLFPFVLLGGLYFIEPQMAFAGLFFWGTLFLTLSVNAWGISFASSKYGLRSSSHLWTATGLKNMGLQSSKHASDRFWVTLTGAAFNLMTALMIWFTGGLVSALTSLGQLESILELFNVMIAVNMAMVLAQALTIPITLRQRSWI